jgi:hypothetical protein
VRLRARRRAPIPTRKPVEDLVAPCPAGREDNVGLVDTFRRIARLRRERRFHAAPVQDRDLRDGGCGIGKWITAVLEHSDLGRPSLAGSCLRRRGRESHRRPATGARRSREAESSHGARACSQSLAHSDSSFPPTTPPGRAEFPTRVLPAARAGNEPSCASDGELGSTRAR